MHNFHFGSEVYPTQKPISVIFKLKKSTDNINTAKTYNSQFTPHKTSVTETILAAMVS